MLFILYTVGMTSFMSYKNVLAFLLIQQSCKRNETERNRKERRERERKLTWRHLAGPPAGPAQPPLQRATWLGQAGRQVPDAGTSARHAAARRPASSPRRPGGLDRSSTSPPTSQTLSTLSSSSPSPSPHHGRRRRARTVVVAAPTVVPEPRRRVRRLRRPRLHRAGRAPSARPPWRRPRPLLPQLRPRRSPSPSRSAPTTPKLAPASAATPVSPASSSPSPLALYYPGTHRTKLTCTHRRGARRRRGSGHPMVRPPCLSASPSRVGAVGPLHAPPLAPHRRFRLRRTPAAAGLVAGVISGDPEASHHLHSMRFASSYP